MINAALLYSIWILITSYRTASNEHIVSRVFYGCCFCRTYPYFSLFFFSSLSVSKHMEELFGVIEWVYKQQSAFMETLYPHIFDILVLCVGCCTKIMYIPIYDKREAWACSSDVGYMGWLNTIPSCHDQCVVPPPNNNTDFMQNLCVVRVCEIEICSQSHEYIIWLSFFFARRRDLWPSISQYNVHIYICEMTLHSDSIHMSAAHYVFIYARRT